MKESNKETEETNRISSDFNHEGSFIEMETIPTVHLDDQENMLGQENAYIGHGRKSSKSRTPTSHKHGHKERKSISKLEVDSIVKKHQSKSTPRMRSRKNMASEISPNQGNSEVEKPWNNGRNDKEMTQDNPIVEGPKSNHPSTRVPTTPLPPLPYSESNKVVEHSEFVPEEDLQELTLKLNEEKFNEALNHFSLENQPLQHPAITRSNIPRTSRLPVSRNRLKSINTRQRSVSLHKPSNSLKDGECNMEFLKKFTLNESPTANKKALGAGPFRLPTIVPSDIRLKPVKGEDPVQTDL